MGDDSAVQSRPEFSVRIVVCDHYLTRPTPGIDVIYSDFRGSDIKQRTKHLLLMAISLNNLGLPWRCSASGMFAENRVDDFYAVMRKSRAGFLSRVPVLRIFGPAADGHKACIHIHGVFPYFYIPCPTSTPEPQLLYQIAASLDKALNIALKQATSATQHVYKISLVKGLPFYGFHNNDHLYLKVFLYNPGLIKQAVELCSNGAILGQAFQPHESHLNFTLQFFIDFNLFGMSNIDLQTAKFRRSGLSQNSHEPENIDETYLKPESICYYEADCMASHIINRQRVGKGDGIENPGLEEVWNQEMERRKQLNVSMASKSLSQTRINDETETHYKFEQMLLVKLSDLIDKPANLEVNVIENEVKSNIDVTKVLEVVNYPAESLEGTQLFNAVDVSVHLPDNTLGASINESSRREIFLDGLDETLIGDADDTIVDVNVALNSSLQYSQVLLDTQDLELVDMLQDMDEKPMGEDSILATPADVDTAQDESDDAEYSQVFNDVTILMEPYKEEDNSKVSPEETSSTWNDSFWEGANIPQLDGTFDDDHVKKVRKRKMRPFKLGLGRPKSKRNANEQIIENNQETDTYSDEIDADEINASRETIDTISYLHNKRNTKKESLTSIVQTNTDIVMKELEDSNDSMMDLVNKFTVKYEKDTSIAAVYDSKNNFEPMAGPSTKNHDQTAVRPLEDDKTYLDDSLELSPEVDVSKRGITSFYNMSKIFDTSLEDNSICEDLNKNQDVAIKDNDVSETNELKSSQETMFPLDFREGNVSTYLDVKKEAKFIKQNTHIILTPKIRPPTKSYIIESLEKYEIPRNKNPEPYYSDHKDVGDKVEIGLMLLKLQSKLAKDQKPFEKVLDKTSIEEWRQLMFLQSNETCEGSKPEPLKILLASNRHCILEPVMKVPKRSEVVQWLQKKEENCTKQDHKTLPIEISKNEDDLDNSQAIGLNEDEINSSISLEASDKDKAEINRSLQVSMQTDGSFLCFGKTTGQNELELDSPIVEVDFLTVMLVEVHTSVRGDLHPDPAVDAIQAIFLTVTNDCPDEHFLEKNMTEIIVVDDLSHPKLLDRCVFHAKVSYVNSESDILERVIELVKLHDPDIICGYEIENNSWGYLLERGQVLGFEVVKEISRITEKFRQKRWKSEGNDFEGRIIGRIMFNVWRLFRHELALSSYSFENCMYEILKERVPKYSYAQLFEWWSDESRLLRWIPVEHYLTRLSGTVRMLEKLDIIHRTSELARLFGLQWWEVLSRGSQFRVESLMLRAARPLNLVALSPTVRQRAAMRAPECLPLIFEPESRFYADPVIVLDFQSLYPSMMIAYNYCFSTCIGRVHNISGDAAYEFGAWRLRIPKSQLEMLVRNGLVHWSPVGVGFVKTSVRRGVLPALLKRILSARQAVKKGMKLQTDPAVKKAMHSRQLGLKLIANVTYGYTAANFSGRMPCVEVGDSVVAKGRETLERAIRMVRDSKRWNAKVVYGDTDSMFVVVPGGDRAQAFAIGQEIADAVTADNPAPVALKLEKVYQPCILQTKKRYVGYMYESADQASPVYEAKGIETVRRDGCPAQVKLLQRALCSLFEDGDMSRVKRSVLETLSRLAAGCLPLHELFFTREYHGPAGYRPGASAPPNEIAKRICARDRRATPRVGQRVPWLVTAGPPNTPLVRLARTPDELTRDLSLTPHVAYYAARVLLPPLHRCLSLLGANVFKWWSELGYAPRPQQQSAVPLGGIARYLWRARCAHCGVRAERALCPTCARTPPAAALCGVRLRAAEAHSRDCRTICDMCCGHSVSWQCTATECPVFWRRMVAGHALEEAIDVFSHLPASPPSLDF